MALKMDDFYWRQWKLLVDSPGFSKSETRDMQLRGSKASSQRFRFLISTPREISSQRQDIKYQKSSENIQVCPHSSPQRREILKTKQAKLHYRPADSLGEICFCLVESHLGTTVFKQKALGDGTLKAL